MRRAIGGFVAWVALALGMSVVAWQAVSLAGAQVNDTADQPVAAAPVAPGGNGTLSSSTTLPIESTSPPTSAASTTTVPDPTQLPDGDPSTAPTTSATVDPRPSSSTSTTAAPATTSAPSASSSSTTSTSVASTTTTAAQWEVSTWRLTGGTVTIRSRPGEVELVSAVPNSGFSSQVEDAGPTRVRVDFESSDHESEFEAKWEAGELDVKLEES